MKDCVDNGVVDDIDVEVDYDVSSDVRRPRWQAIVSWRRQVATSCGDKASIVDDLGDIWRLRLMATSCGDVVTSILISIDEIGRRLRVTTWMMK